MNSVVRRVPGRTDWIGPEAGCVALGAPSLVAIRRLASDWHAGKVAQEPQAQNLEYILNSAKADPQQRFRRAADQVVTRPLEHQFKNAERTSSGTIQQAS